MKNVFGKSIDAFVELFRSKELAKRPVSKASRISSKKLNKSSHHVDDVHATVAEIEEALMRIGASGRGVMTGRVQVLRYDQLREELGEEWARLGSRIEIVIESIIRQNLTAEDMHWRLAEHAYLLLFASLSPADAEVKCALIRAKIEEYFKGNPNLTGKVIAETTVSSVDGKIQLRPLEDLVSLFDRLELAQTEGHSEEHQTGNDRSDNGERGEVSWQTVTDDIAAAREEITHIKFVQRPIWDTSTRAVKFLALMPVDARRSKSYSGGSILRAWTGGALTLALDEASVRKVHEAQAEEIIGRSNSNWFQVHYGTLENPQLRRDLFVSLGTIDEASISSHAVELIGLPKKMQLRPDSPVRHALGRCTGEVAACCDLLSPQFTGFSEDDVDWVGFTMRNSNLEKASAIKAISRFVKLAERSGYEIYARDLPTHEVVEAAIALGVRYIFGSTVSTHVDGHGDGFRIEDLCD